MTGNNMGWWWIDVQKFIHERTHLLWHQGIFTLLTTRKLLIVRCLYGKYTINGEYTNPSVGGANILSSGYATRTYNSARWASGTNQGSTLSVALSLVLLTNLTHEASREPVGRYNKWAWVSSLQQVCCILFNFISLASNHLFSSIGAQFTSELMDN